MVWQKGQSGNPGGKRKPTAQWRKFQSLCQEYSLDAFKVLKDLINSDDEKIQLRAVSELLDRAFGKPTQAIDIGQSVETVEEFVELPKSRRIEMLEAALDAEKSTPGSVVIQ
mgnify:CR=1 FL=1|tara:strand:+ start:209 stop:544 length:336 start_codon:yes stop_codon:yes gene_type:complete